MQLENVLAEGKALVAAGPGQHAAELVRAVAHQLINACEMSFNDHEARNMAANLVTELARHDPSVVDLLITSARRYAETQHIDDAFPYSPNSFDVLSRIGRGDQKVISFLRQTVESDWGIPRWEAVDALCALKEPEADRVLRDVLDGKYPPKKLDLESDIRRIETAKGRDFIGSHRGPP